MRSPGRSIVGIASLASLLMLSGCASTKVVGRVLPGAISHVGVVDATDPRTSQAGLAGIEVTVSPLASDGTTTILGRAVSGDDGSFAIKIDGDRWPTDRVEVRATSDSYATARGSVYLPRESQRLLILLERTAGD